MTTDLNRTPTLFSLYSHEDIKYTAHTAGEEIYNNNNVLQQQHSMCVHLSYGLSSIHPSSATHFLRIRQSFGLCGLCLAIPIAHIMSRPFAPLSFSPLASNSTTTSCLLHAHDTLPFSLLSVPTASLFVAYSSHRPMACQRVSLVCGGRSPHAQ